MTGAARSCTITPEEIEGYFKVIHCRARYFEGLAEEGKTRYAAGRREEKL